MPDDRYILSGDEIYAWIETVFAQGVRRPGYPADRWAETWCRDQFTSLGLQNVRLEPVELNYWEPRSATLTARSSDGESIEIPCFAVPHAASTPASGLDARLVAYDRNEPANVAGAASLYDVRLLRTPFSFYTSIATSVYDPANTFEGASQILPFGREFQEVMEPSIAAGATAFIGALPGYPGDSREYYVPYDGHARAIPGVWISGSDGARLRAMLDAGPVDVHLAVDAERRRETCFNVVGELPGADDETVVIGSHHDGPWSSAVEDGSGIALVLAQAAYWSRVPQSERPHRLVFLLNAGHMHGGAGAVAFCEQHRDELPNTVLAVHLEHAAREFTDRNGTPERTGHPEAAWWFTTRNPQLESTVAAALEAEDLRRSFVLPPTALGPRPTTDGSEFYVCGVPIVNFLTAPFYLFDAMDTLDKIDRAALAPLTRAAIRIIESTRNVSASSMRAGVVG